MTRLVRSLFVLLTVSCLGLGLYLLPSLGENRFFADRRPGAAWGVCCGCWTLGLLFLLFAFKPQRAIRIAIVAAIASGALWGAVLIVTQMLANVPDAATALAFSLQLFQSLCGVVCLGTVAVPVVSAIGMVFIFVFFPVVLANHRSGFDWARTLALTGGTLFLGLHDLIPMASSWVPDEFETWCAGLARRLDQHMIDNPTASYALARLLSALTVAMVLYVGICIVIVFFNALAPHAIAFFVGIDKVAKRVTDAMSQVGVVIRQPPTTNATAQLFVAIWLCLLLNLILFVVAVIHGDMSAGGVVIPALVITGIGLKGVVSQPKPPAPAPLLTSILPAAILTVVAAVYVIAVRKATDGDHAFARTVYSAYDQEGPALVRLMLRDLALSLLFAFLAPAVLVKGWRRVLIPRIAPQPPLMINPTPLDLLSKCLYGTVLGFLLSKLLAIVLCWIACATFAGKPQQIAGLRDVNGLPFFYMSWSGEVLNVEEYVYANHAEFAPSVKDGRSEETLDKNAYETVLSNFRERYAPFYACMVVVQSVFGWNMGIGPLSFLFFTYAIVVFRYPKPGAGLTPTQYVMGRVAMGAAERIREAAEGITVLGFVGTLLGLSQAIFFLGQGDVVSDFLGRPGISAKLSGSLGLAFFTTFVAMILRLIMNLHFSQLAGEDPGYQRLQRALR